MNPTFNFYNLTPEEKINVLKKAYKIVERNEAPGMCLAIIMARKQEGLRPQAMHISELYQMMPEFFEFKPKQEEEDSVYWFKNDEHAKGKRLDYLKMLINKIDERKSY